MKPNRIIDQYGVIHVLDASGFYVPYEDPDPEIPRWKFATVWILAIILCLGTLYLAGQCLSMAWRMLPL